MSATAPVGRAYPWPVPDLHDVVRAALGPGRRLTGVERLGGGTRKGVHRLTLDDGTTAIAYVWAPELDSWAGRPDPDEDVGLPGGGGPRELTTVTAILQAAGVRVPELSLVDPDARLHPVPVAVVEDVRGPTLDTLLRTDPAAARAAVRDLCAALARMEATRAPGFGPPGRLRTDTSFAEAVAARAGQHLERAAAAVPSIAVAGARVREVLGVRAAAVAPRESCCLVHGELGPDHVIVRDGGAVLIDVEGAGYGDSEWEHAYVRLRMGSAAPPAVRPLDPARLRLYRLAHSLSLIAGPLRMLGGPHPEQEFWRALVEHHSARVGADVDRPQPGLRSPP